MGSTVGITDQLLSRSPADVHTPARVYPAYLGLILGSMGTRLWTGRGPEFGARIELRRATYRPRAGAREGVLPDRV